MCLLFGNVSDLYLLASMCTGRVVARNMSTHLQNEGN